jgi:hypothetical protein
MSQQSQGTANRTEAKKPVSRLRVRRSTLLLWAFFLITLAVWVLVRPG